MTNQASPEFKPALPVALGIMLAILLLVVLALQQGSLPAPAGASSAANTFSAERAMTRLQIIAREAHPTGSAENAQVRSYLLAQLKELGMETQEQSGMGFNTSPDSSSAGMVHNVMGRLPGSAGGNGKALMLAAHYDSVANGRGAADDGASVAAILETVRAIKSGPPLKNDVIVLLTDAEEQGLLGSSVFTRDHAWAKQVGLVLNFEFRGNGGPMLMFETSAGNGKLVTAYADKVERPYASSLLYEIYRVLPNDTDMTNFKASGMPGMNFAAIENLYRYHSARDNPDLLNQSTLQHLGDTMLVLTRHFGDTPLADLKADDRIYFKLPLLGMVQYGTGLIWPLALLALVLFGVALVAAIKSERVRPVRTILSGLLFLPAVLIPAIVSQLLWFLMVKIHPENRMLQEPYNSHWYLLAFLMLTLGLFMLLQKGFSRWYKPLELSFGGLTFWIVLMLIGSKALPGASFILTLPLLPILAVQVFLQTKGKDMADATRNWVVLASAAPAIIMLAPVIVLIFTGISIQFVAATSLLIALLLVLLLPVLFPLCQRFLLPLLPLGLTVLFFAVGLATHAFSPAQPKPSNLFYVLDGASGKTWWVSRDKKLDTWNKAFFNVDAGQRVAPELFGPKPRQVWVNTAPAIPGVTAPQVAMVQDTLENNLRTITLHIQSTRKAPKIIIEVDGMAVESSKIDGKPFTETPNKDFSLELIAMPEQGFDFTFQVKPGKPFQTRVTDETYGLPKDVLANRGEAMMTGVFGTFGDTVRAVQLDSFK